MRKSLLCKIFISIWVLVSFSASECYSQTRIFFNLNEIMTLKTGNLDSYSALDCNGFDFIGLCDARYYPENEILLRTNMGVFLYDCSSNKLVTSFSRKGKASYEYTYVSDFGMVDNLVYIYDINTKKILWFDKTGKYLKTDFMSDRAGDKPFSSFARCGNGYIGKRIYSMTDAPQLAFYDNEFRFLKDIEGVSPLTSGIDLYKQFSRGSEGEILYTYYFDRKIMAVSPQGAKDKYIVDFGKYNVPDIDRFKDEYDIIDYVNSAEKKMATYVSRINENECFLSFFFILHKGKSCLGVYDFNTGKTASYIFHKDESETVTIVPGNNCAYVFYENEDGNVNVGQFLY